MLNVREANTKQIQDNTEVSALKKILGLKQGIKYTSTKDLRYGHVMLMTDQDHDGSHIKGLLLNLFATFWPELLQLPGFLQVFITPIVKVKKGAEGKEKSIKFYTIPQFEQWREGHINEAGWTIKYYKGLGTSSASEAREYCSALDVHQLNFTYTGPSCDQSIELAFGKSKVEARKDWLAEYKQGTYLDQSLGSLSYTDFVNKELILFSLASNQRAIPSLCDGLKPGQRKILYVCFKRNLTKEIKVAQLCGSVAEKSAYHHGEASLASTITAMAQDYVGSNNINYLFPSGQFGTRLQGGKDAASPRYIFTRLCPITRYLFPIEDDSILHYLTDDGQLVEPEYYMPIIPTVLVNGTSGIGTGWSSNIPSYNPRAIVTNIKLWMEEKPLQPMVPWYREFTGQITASGEYRYTVHGRIEQINETTLRITELPTGFWTCDHKDILQSLLESGMIKEIREHHTDTKVSFTIIMTKDQMTVAHEKGFYSFFKLTSSLATSNMVLFDHEGKLKRYNSVQDIMSEFCTIRLQYYVKRKERLIHTLSEECNILQNKVKFILAVRARQFDITKDDELLLKQLKSGQYTRYPKKTKLEKTTNDDDDKNIESGSDSDSDSDSTSETIKLSDYSYLVNMPVSSIGLKLANKLQAELTAKLSRLETIKNTTPKSMWIQDLDHFVNKGLVQFENEYKLLVEKEEKLMKGVAKKNSTSTSKKNKTNDISTKPGVYIPPTIDSTKTTTLTIQDKKRKNMEEKEQPTQTKKKKETKESKEVKKVEPPKPFVKRKLEIVVSDSESESSNTDSAQIDLLESSSDDDSSSSSDIATTKKQKITSTMTAMRMKTTKLSI